MDRTEAIASFLATQELKVDLYTPEMEVQVNVIVGPERVKDDTKRKVIWTDGEHNWSPFRIPYRGGGLDAKPEYRPTEQQWPLPRYAEAIGCTGWNWFKRHSLYVGFDFDSIVGHKTGLNEDELASIRERVVSIPWITLRRSKGGKGYHLYVFFNKPVETENHTEHAALARAVLSQLSAILNFPFESKVDVVGGVLWVWHRSASREARSFEIIKKATEGYDPPPNWREHIDVLNFKRKSTPVEDSKEFLELVARTPKVVLDDEHRRLLAWFAQQRQALWWWDADYNMLVCHTHDLRTAHTELRLKGIFRTDSSGSTDQNCFAFPARNGSWTVRRHGLKTRENDYWSLDSSGWRRCRYNALPDLATAARMSGGIKTSKGVFVFQSLEKAAEALEVLGVHIDLGASKKLLYREATIAPGKTEGEIVLTVTREISDNFEFSEWAPVRGPKWERVFQTEVETYDITPPDDLIRYTTLGNSGGSWFIKNKDSWVAESKDNAKSALEALGIAKADVQLLLGKTIFNAWELVVLPFKEEYPGGRQWNLRAPQFAVKPNPGDFSTWSLIFNHVGKGLDKSVAENSWCKEHAVADGYSYLMLWFASLIKHPFEPLPYLFFWGPQNSGKSIIHEAFGMAFKDGIGYVRADNALKSQSGFNGELAHAVLCVVEETDLSRNGLAYDRIKDWATGKTLAVRPMHHPTYIKPNTTHWIQCANPATHCPILPGDTRITVCHVDLPSEDIPKSKLMASLRDELPAFLHRLLHLEIPETSSRLRIPVLESNIKFQLEDISRSALQVFLSEWCTEVPGHVVKLSDFYDKFVSTLDAQERFNYSTRKVAKELPLQFPRGRWGDGGPIHIGNINVRGIIADVASHKRLERSPQGKLV